MAKGKGKPTFKVPDGVQKSTQSGWVYRSGVEQETKEPETKAASTPAAPAKKTAKPREQRSAPKVSSKAPAPPVMTAAVSTNGHKRHFLERLAFPLEVVCLMGLSIAAAFSGSKR